MQLYYHWKHQPSQDLMNSIKEKNIDCEFIEVNQIKDTCPEFLKGVPTVVEDEYMYTGSHAIQYIDEKISQKPPTPKSTEPIKEKVDMNDCKNFLAQRSEEIKQDAIPAS